ncbi:MAG: hypothetical protein NTY08_18325 [Proteobacteria bacterium]|nr:hypothetical protein [Pseudomonadota bacterium]
MSVAHQLLPAVFWRCRAAAIVRSPAGGGTAAVIVLDGVLKGVSSAPSITTLRSMLRGSEAGIISKSPTLRSWA